MSNQAVTGSRPDTSILVDVELLDQLMNLVGELALARNQILQHSNLLELIRLEGHQRVEGIETLHGAMVYRLRGQLLPLVSLSDVFGGGDTPSEGTLNVVVTGDGDNAVGLVVGQILDIVEEHISVQTRSARPGVATTAVVQGKVTEIIDVQTILAMNPLAA